MLRRPAALILAAPFVALAAPADSANQCKVVDVDFRPAESPNPVGMRFPLQIVAWLEDAQGNYVDTIFITQEVGTFGLGNRPGRFDFNSGPLWPYGRRSTVFPIWANRHGLEFPEVVFQNDDDNNLSHPFTQSSSEIHFCKPLMRAEASWDAASCASVVFTDKGTLHPTRKSKYPPRQDITRASQDTPSVDMYDLLNPFDAVSTATPASGQPALVSWPIPPELPAGNYVLMMEVAREFDANATYNATTFPPPGGIPWADYGLPYRGQPSVVYRVPFAIGPGEQTAVALEYAGYSDPTAADGSVRAPDATITTDVLGSGAGRLAVIPHADGDYRVRVVARNEEDNIAPGIPAVPRVDAFTSTAATISFRAPGDDGKIGKVKGYEVRYRTAAASGGSDMTEANFAESSLITATVPIHEPGTLTTFSLQGLLPETTYAIGIRAFDDCRNTSPLAILQFTTAPRTSGEVDACFVATAAYGSVMADDVEPLRRLRDTVLRRTTLGELFVETYYTLGPAVSGVVGESELLRSTARTALDPIVAWAKRMSNR
ncbi:MAG: fibronectin type III domain-containing protein [Deltaproteobacteria bacterium]|nr:fibronectin type III domain-containing protein [Deltaproteobacteria bacterium]